LACHRPIPSCRADIDPRARPDRALFLPLGDAFAEHHAYQRVPVVDVRVVEVVACRENDPILVLGGKVVALEEEVGIAVDLDVVGDRGDGVRFVAEDTWGDHGPLVDRQRRSGYVLEKEGAGSAGRIDAAIALVLAWEARTDAGGPGRGGKGYGFYTF
jgi:hypothetical protein